jgi:uncharacterized protein
MAIQPSGSRVMKYRHLLEDKLDADAAELAVLCALMLRGPQTLGELHARTARLAEFSGLAALERTLDALIAREPAPLVVRLPRRPGQKEVRYAHLLSGEAAAQQANEAHDGTGGADGGAARGAADDERVAALERSVEELRGEIAALRAELAEFRSQFQ